MAESDTFVMPSDEEAQAAKASDSGGAGASDGEGGTPSGASLRAPAASSAAVRKSMQGNKGKNTKPELLVRQRLREAGLTGYRIHWNKVPGKPDVAWPGKRVALFVQGCFWHRCPHCKPPMPKSHIEYWVVKFDRNVERDERTLRELEDVGWRVHVIWECQLKKRNIDATMADLLPQLAAELGKELKTPVGEPTGADAGGAKRPAGGCTDAKQAE